MSQKLIYTKNSIKKLYDMSDNELAKKFLTRKTKDKITLEILGDEAEGIRRKANPDGTKVYPKVSALPTPDFAYFVYQIFMQYDLIARDAKKYDVNIESLIKVYEKLMEENWIYFDQERLELDKRFVKEDKSRDLSPRANVYMVKTVIEIIKLIDLTKVSNTSYSI